MIVLTRPGRRWRLAPVLASLRQEIDLAWPIRSTLTDGSIGDTAHRFTNSDHNPDDNGYVRAIDLTRDDHDGPPMAQLAEYLRRVGASGSQRLALGGLIVYNRRRCSELTEWQWVPYGGTNPHTTHLHLSCSRLPAFYKIGRPWGVAASLRTRTW